MGVRLKLAVIKSLVDSLGPANLDRIHSGTFRLPPPAPTNEGGKLASGEIDTIESGTAGHADLERPTRLARVRLRRRPVKYRRRALHPALE